MHTHNLKLNKTIIANQILTNYIHEILSSFTADIESISVDES